MGRKAAPTTETKAGMGLTGASVSSHSGYKNTIDSRAIVPVQDEPTMEIAAIEENSDHKDSVLIRAGHLQSSGGPTENQNGVKTTRSGSIGSLWRKLLRKSKIGPTHDQPGKARSKRNHWVRDLRNLFICSKQHYPERNPGGSTIQPEYLLVQDEELPPRSTVPPQDGRLKLFWKLTDSELQNHANISMTGGCAQEIEESVPLLEYPEVLAKPDGAGAGDACRAIAPPWILRKWEMKDSQKLLTIHPERDMLFHSIDKANEQYSCSIILQNRTKGFVAFKFKGTCPQAFAMKPKHGLLGPNLTMKVDALRYGDPFLSSGKKKDLFVIMSLPVPASLIKNKAVGSFVFRRFEHQCRCEGVLRAIFRSPETELKSKSYESEVDKQTRMDDLHRRLTLNRLISIPESETDR